LKNTARTVNAREQRLRRERALDHVHRPKGIRLFRVHPQPPRSTIETREFFNMAKKIVFSEEFAALEHDCLNPSSFLASQQPMRLDVQNIVRLGDNKLFAELEA
jgi:hypothetical protein